MDRWVMVSVRAFLSVLMCDTKLYVCTKESRPVSCNRWIQDYDSREHWICATCLYMTWQWWGLGNDGPQWTSRTFKCSLSNHRKAFHRSANAIFGKIGRIASEDVILQLIKSKWIPSLLYGVDARALTKNGFSLTRDEWVKRAKNLDSKYIACERAFVHYGSTMFHWLWLCYVGVYVTVFLHCALAATQCIVIGPICLQRAGGVGLLPR